MNLTNLNKQELLTYFNEAMKLRIPLDQQERDYDRGVSRNGITLLEKEIESYEEAINDVNGKVFIWSFSIVLFCLLLTIGYVLEEYISNPWLGFAIVVIIDLMILALIKKIINNYRRSSIEECKSKIKDLEIRLQEKSVPLWHKLHQLNYEFKTKFPELCSCLWGCKCDKLESSPEALNFYIRMLKSGRANNFRELLREYDEEVHRQAVLANQENMFNEQQDFQSEVYEQLEELKNRPQTVHIHKYYKKK